MLIADALFYFVEGKNALFDLFVGKTVADLCAENDFAVHLYGVFRFVEYEFFLILYGIVLIEYGSFSADFFKDLFRKVGGAGR